MSFLLRTCATDEVIAKTYAADVNLRQRFGMIEKLYVRMLCHKVLRRGPFFRQTVEVPLHRKTTARNASTKPSAPFPKPRV